MADKGEKYNDKANSGGFGQYIWNPATKELLGRTGASWFKIIVFYIIFYICLAAFWALMLLIFYQTLDERYPKYQLTDSRIGANPGLGFRPRPRAEHVESTLIWFKNAKDENSWQHWSEGLTDFLKPYEKANEDDSGAHIQKCEEDKGAEEGKFCFFNIKDISNNCSAGQDFGYRRGDPCVLIKLNRIYGWKPEPFSDDDLKDKTIPDVVRSQYANRKNGSQLIYITCDGENAADKENIGPVSYYPQQGIEFKYFPFSNQPGYLSPFIFVHFSKPAAGITINIECKAWAKNIKHNRMDREGSVHFELLMDGY